MRIKMGADSDSIYNCTDDGQLRGNLLTFGQCFFISPIETITGR
jgi:hypothetical protein